MGKIGKVDLTEKLRNRESIDSTRPNDGENGVKVNNNFSIENDVQTKEIIIEKNPINENETKVKIGFWVSYDLKEEIDIYCIENNRNLQEVTESAINSILKSGMKALAKVEVDTREEKQVFCRVTTDQRKQLKLFCVKNKLSIKEAGQRALIKQIR